jgi:hypothetical protein
MFCLAPLTMMLATVFLATLLFRHWKQGWRVVRAHDVDELCLSEGEGASITVVAGQRRYYRA